jgi:hypothetical protein
MGWLEILGTLAQAVVQSEQRDSNPLGLSSRAARRARSYSNGVIGETRVTVIPPDPRDEIARAEAETRRMLEEAYEEMIDERVDHGVRRMAERLDETSARVIDIETHVDDRLEKIATAVDDIRFETRKLDRLQKTVNALLALVVALLVLCGYLLYLF